MSDAKRDKLIGEAEALREKGEARAGIEVLLEYAEATPRDWEAALLVASMYDSIGQERNALPFYERALDNADIPEPDFVDAGIGFGSSLRALGEFDKAIEVLGRVIERRPDNRAAQTFLAMARFNAGEQQEGFQVLLEILADSTNDMDIRQYSGALKFYAEDIAATWG